MATTSTSRALTDRLVSARATTDALLTIVRPEALYERPIGERHRIVFYIGHLEAFDWNLIRSTIADIPAFNEEFDRLFAFGIDPVGTGLPTDVPSDWPDIAEIHAYCRNLRSILDREMARLPESAKSDQILNVAIEHRLMHAETLAYMFHWLAAGQKIAQSEAPPLPAAARIEEPVAIPRGIATLGLPTGGAFGWDNEFVEHAVEVPEFVIDRYPVTNDQFMEFVRAGGYDDKSLWAEADWHWKDALAIRHPKFWNRHDGNWWFRGMFNELPLPGDWPVYVSHAEASAYALWVHGRLPSEAEWHRAAYGTVVGKERTFPWGEQQPSRARGNFDFARWNPEPVTSHREGASAFGVEDLAGNGWEWTSTVFGPFEGFERFSFYPGYSADFFDGKHFVMKGGSARTAACMLRRSFRNWFQTRYPHIYAGFRCVYS